MAHDLSIVNGRAELAYAGETPWHGLGTRVTEQSPAGMLSQAGMNWTVIPESVYLDGQIKVAGYKALTRSDTRAPLAVVSDRYQPIQNAQAGDMMGALIGAGAKVCVAGALAGGRRCWLLAKVPGDFDVVKGDTVKSYVLLAWGHDGFHGLAAKLTPIRVVCQNTLNAALPGKWSKSADVYLRHTRNAELRIDQAREALGLIAKQTEHVAELYRSLASRMLTGAEAVQFAADVFPYPIAKPQEGSSILGAPDTASDLSALAAVARAELTRGAEAESSDAARIRINESREAVLRLMDAGKGAELAGHTAWGAYNAVTEWADRVYPVLKSGEVSKTRQESVLFGSYNTVKSRALNAATALLS